MTSITSDALPRRIPLAEPLLHGNEWKYVKDCLDTNWVSSVGSYVDRFEQMLAQRAGVRHAVACVNGTSALHVAYMVAGIGADDEVMMPALTFAAPAFAARYVGAWPLFIDVDRTTLTIDPVSVRDALVTACEVRDGHLVNKQTGRRVRAIVAVDLLGHPADMDALRAIADEYRLCLIEDAAESLGAVYRGLSIGSKSDVACFSFNGNKIITTGGGGMLVTNNASWAERARYLTTQAKDDPVEYIHNAVGYNYRLTNIQAALGVAQMEQLDAFVAAKRRIAERYRSALAGIPGIRVPQEAPWAQSTYWLYTIGVDPKTFGMTSRELLKMLTSDLIASRPLWHPLHSLPPFVGCTAHRVAVADEWYASGLSIPCSVGLSEEDQHRVCEAIRHAARTAS